MGSSRRAPWPVLPVPSGAEVSEAEGTCHGVVVLLFHPSACLRLPAVGRVGGQLPRWKVRGRSQGSAVNQHHETNPLPYFLLFNRQEEVGI